MPADNQFKRGELYSIITGIASAAICRSIQKHFRTANLDLTVEQWTILYHLWKEDGLSQQELCRRSFKDKASITRLLHNMEKQDLVKRVTSSQDRRSNHIYLTTTAHNLKDLTTQLATDTLNEGLQGITKAEIDIVRKVLQQVYDNLTE